MECESCKIGMVERRTTEATPYRYDLSGLSDVGLIGIVVHHCPQCGDERPMIPRIAELHRVIAVSLINKEGPLSGEEVRFLRKQAGFPQRQFSALLRLSQEHISRVENDAGKHLSDTAEKMARAIVAAVVVGGEEARDILLEVGSALDRQLRRPSPDDATTSVFHLDSRNHWKSAANG